MLPSFPSLSSPSYLFSILLNYHLIILSLLSGIFHAIKHSLPLLCSLLDYFLFSTLISSHSFLQRKTTVRIQTLLSKEHPLAFSPSQSLWFTSILVLLDLHSCHCYPITHLECYNIVRLNVRHSSTLRQTDT